ncbi:MAG: enoyl-CoA hydratase-related protein, partial [Burkholderiales bacterium]
MPAVLVSTADGVMTITLNRPDKLNAFVREMHGLLREAMTQAESDAGVRALLITGAGRGFCAGQDLAERDMNEAHLDLGGGLDANYNPFIRRLRALPKPV